MKIHRSFCSRFHLFGIFSVCFLLSTSSLGLFAQPVLPYAYPRQMGASELKESMLRLRVLGSALFIAAHPDDENTRLIAWLAGERKVNTTYLSITRGDGGQNLIGSEIEEMLGVLRTQELLMARGVDRGEQMFTRANDFGYSKHPDETMQIWDRQEVLADVVWAIRRTRPDVVITDLITAVREQLMGIIPPLPCCPLKHIDLQQIQPHSLNN